MLGITHSLLLALDRVRLGEEEGRAGQGQPLALKAQAGLALAQDELRAHAGKGKGARDAGAKEGARSAHHS